MQRASDWRGERAYIQEQPPCRTPTPYEGRYCRFVARAGKREQFDNEHVNFPEVVNVLRRQSGSEAAAAGLWTENS